MKWSSLIRVALKNILKNKMRSLLTMLGIIIGVGSVIAMVSLGEGTQQDVKNQIASLGTNLLIVTPGGQKGGGVSQGAGSRNALTLNDIDLLKKQTTLVAYLSPEIKVGVQVIAAGNNWATSISGVFPEYLHIREWSVEMGQFFTQRDLKTRAKVAVLGRTAADELFPEQDPIGARIRIRNVPFKVIGVLESKGKSVFGPDQDDIILAPATTVIYRLTRGRWIHAVLASAETSDLLEAAQNEIRSIMRDAHRLKISDEDDFNIQNQAEITEVATRTTSLITLFLSAVAGVSLLVGGIGIMNIMLVSVTERTREIGIRLAVGAKDTDVLAQFLIEAVILSSLGGLIGILFGVSIGYLLSQFIGISILVQPSIILISFLFSGAVGVFFGFYPARKAANLNPIDALRYE